MPWCSKTPPKIGDRFVRVRADIATKMGDAIEQGIVTEIFHHIGDTVRVVTKERRGKVTWYVRKNLGIYGAQGPDWAVWREKEDGF